MTEATRTGQQATPPQARVRHAFVTNLSAGARLDAVLISAVTALLGLRLYLYLTGFPQVGGKSFHIAHMLYGGLLMIVAVVILLAFIDRAGQWTGAVLGGAGFGIFIDELGKFITRDINYFYQPAVSVMYVLFVVLYLATRDIMDRRSTTPDTALANGLEMAKSVVLHNASPTDVRKLQHCLQRADAGNPVVQALLSEIEVLTTEEEGQVHSLAVGMRWRYRLLLQNPVVQSAVVIAAAGVVALVFVVAVGADVIALVPLTSMLNRLRLQSHHQ